MTGSRSSVFGGFLPLTRIDTVSPSGRLTTTACVDSIVPV